MVVAVIAIIIVIIICWMMIRLTIRAELVLGADQVVKKAACG